MAMTKEELCRVVIQVYQQFSGAAIEEHAVLY